MTMGINLLMQRQSEYLSDSENLFGEIVFILLFKTLIFKHSKHVHYGIYDSESRSVRLCRA